MSRERLASFVTFLVSGTVHVQVYGKLYFVFPNGNVQCNGNYILHLFASKNLSKHINEVEKVL